MKTGRRKKTKQTTLNLAAHQRGGRNGEDDADRKAAAQQAQKNYTQEGGIEAVTEEMEINNQGLNKIKDSMTVKQCGGRNGGNSADWNAAEQEARTQRISAGGVEVKVEEMEADQQRTQTTEEPNTQELIEGQCGKRYKDKEGNKGQEATDIVWSDGIGMEKRRDTDKKGDEHLCAELQIEEKEEAR